MICWKCGSGSIYQGDDGLQCLACGRPQVFDIFHPPVRRDQAHRRQHYLALTCIVCNKTFEVRNVINHGRRPTDRVACSASCGGRLREARKAAARERGAAA